MLVFFFFFQANDSSKGVREIVSVLLWKQELSAMTANPSSHSDVIIAKQALKSETKDIKWELNYSRSIML